MMSKLAKEAENMEALTRLYIEFKSHSLRDEDDADITRIKLDVAREKALAASINVRKLLDDMEESIEKEI